MAPTIVTVSSPATPGKVIVMGVAAALGFHVLVNVAMVIGAMPVTGIPLPIMSYGGSAILMNLVAMAIVLRVDIENRQMMRGGRA